jgi:hypothetical protein
MSHEVYADGMEIAGKATMNKSIARFPDVCLSPPSPPAGPIPVPYPDTSFSSDLKEGSQTVKLGGESAALAQQSYYQPAVLGDEAATKTLGMNVVTHQITGKTYFQAWSMDVLIEGKNVCRHVDITTSNHASPPPGSPGAPSIDKQTLELIKEGKCPCCEKPLHPNQVDEHGTPYQPITEQDYYERRGAEAEATMQAKLDSIPGDIEAGMAYTQNPASLAFVQKRTAEQLQEVKDARATVANARNIDPPCENLHNPKDAKCGTHFDMKRTLRSLAPPGTEEKAIKKTVRENVLGFTDSVKKDCREIWRAKGRKIGKSSPVNHMTPLSAGGCPIGQKNLIPSDALSDDCKKVDAAQTKLQEIGEKQW